MFLAPLAAMLAAGGASNDAVLLLGPRSPPRPSPGSLHYSDEDVSTKYNDLIPAESSSLTEKPSEVSDSQVRPRPLQPGGHVTGVSCSFAFVVWVCSLIPALWLIFICPGVFRLSPPPPFDPCQMKASGGGFLSSGNSSGISLIIPEHLHTAGTLPPPGLIGTWS